MQTSALHSQSRFPTLVRFRAPAGFMEAIDHVARQQHQCVSDYVRQLLVREMRKAGVRLNADGRVETTDTGATGRGRP
jgi:hypothetical protein